MAVARNLAEGEMLQGILLEEGIPSYLRRSGGFDVPDFLAAGPRDVMVPSSGVSAARELLGTDDPAVMELDSRPSQNAFRILAAILIVLLLASLITGTLWSLTR